MSARNRRLELNETIDDVYNVVIVVGSILLGFERLAGYPTIEMHAITEFVLVNLTIVSMILWSVGHLLDDSHWAQFYKMLSWLIWTVQFANVILFSIWGPFLELTNTGGIPATILCEPIVLSMVVITCLLLKRGFRMERKWTIAALVIGIFVGAISPFLLIN